MTEDDVLTVLEAGAEDVNDLDDSFEVVCEPGDLVAVRTALQDAGIDYESAEASFQPSVTVPVDLAARKVLKLVDALEDSDDVQDVYTNIDIPDDVAASSTTRSDFTLTFCAARYVCALEIVEIAGYGADCRSGNNRLFRLIWPCATAATPPRRQDPGRVTRPHPRRGCTQRHSGPNSRHQWCA